MTAPYLETMPLRHIQIDLLHHIWEQSHSIKNEVDRLTFVKVHEQLIKYATTKDTIQKTAEDLGFINADGVRIKKAFWFCDETLKADEVLKTPYQAQLDTIVNKQAGVQEAQRRYLTVSQYSNPIEWRKTQRGTVTHKDWIVFLCTKCKVEYIQDRIHFEQLFHKQTGPKNPELKKYTRKESIPGAHQNCILCRYCQCQVIKSLGYNHFDDKDILGLTGYDALLNIAPQLMETLGLPDYTYDPFYEKSKIIPIPIVEDGNFGDLSETEADQLIADFKNAPEGTTPDEKTLKALNQKWINKNLEDGTQQEVNEYLQSQMRPGINPNLMNEKGLHEVRNTHCLECGQLLIDYDKGHPKKFCNANCKMRYNRKQKKP